MRLSERFRTPYVALLAQGLWSSLLIAVPGSELSQLFNYFGFASWLFYALTAVSATELRFDDAEGASLVTVRVTYMCDELLLARAEDGGLLVFERIEGPVRGAW